MAGGGVVVVTGEGVVVEANINCNHINDCFCSDIVHKLYNQFEALMVRANDYV